MTSLTGQDESDSLAEELELTASAATLPDRADVELSDYEDEHWMPDPVDADLCTVLQGERQGVRQGA